jgi:hypothetical protein
VINGFPLSWPEGWPRAKHRGPSPYKVTTDSALTELLNELKLMGAKHVVVSSNVPLRRDGTMYRGDHSDSQMPDPGVAVYWDDREGNPRAIACDDWLTVRENVRALGMAIEYLRGLKRCGASEILNRAFMGFKRLSASSSDCWTTLGIERGASRERITERYRHLAREHHPDRGGSAQTMAMINKARDEALSGIGAS